MNCLHLLTRPEIWVVLLHMCTYSPAMPEITAKTQSPQATNCRYYSYITGLETMPAACNAAFFQGQIRGNLCCSGCLVWAKYFTEKCRKNCKQDVLLLAHFPTLSVSNPDPGHVHSSSKPNLVPRLSQQQTENFKVPGLLSRTDRSADCTHNTYTGSFSVWFGTRCSASSWFSPLACCCDSFTTATTSPCIMACVKT